MFQFNPFTGTLDLNSGPGSFADDVVEYPSKAAFPVPGEAGKLYVDRSTDRAYRWPENGADIDSYREVSGTEVTQAELAAKADLVSGKVPENQLPIPTGYFDRAGDATSRPPAQGQAQHQVVLSNDSRLFDPRQVAWVQPPISPFIPEPTPASELITGTQYIIAVVGDTDWTAIGFPSITLTASAAAGSTTLQITEPSFALIAGMRVSGPGIATGTTITTLSGSAFSLTATLSQPTTAAINGALTFSNTPVSGSPFTKNSTPGTGTGSAIPAFGNPEPPALGTAAYDGSYLYIVVPAPGGQSVRWARTPLSMTW
jgi:hypothetical protein